MPTLINSQLSIAGKREKDAEGAIEFEQNLHNNIPEGIQFDIEDLQVNVFDKTAVAAFHIYVTSEVNAEKQQSQAQIFGLFKN